MYSTKKNVLQLVSLLKKAGIQDYVLCPGSRNIPLVQTIVSIEGFHCHSVTDERSAGFYAIGLIQALQRPVAVCCTSGSAVLNLHPSVCEAFYQQLPLLVLTADRPKEWIGQMDGQTLPQAEAFGSLVKKSVTLPEVKDKTEEWYCNRLVNEALYALNAQGLGPVQINIPLSEPFFDFSQGSLPDERLVTHIPARNTCTPPILAASVNKAQSVMLIIGQRSYEDCNLNALMEVCKEKGILVVCEHLANIPSHYPVRSFDEILATNSDISTPELVIYTGGHIVSKRLKKWLRTNPPARLWWVAGDDSMPDTFQHLTSTIQTPDVYTFLTGLFKETEMASKRKEYVQYWKLLETHVIANRPFDRFDSCFCDVAVLHRFTEHLKNYSHYNNSIQVANSSMVRNLQLFPLPEHTRVLCNRGVNGIEGSLSTSVGYALGRKELAFCLIGDLSFFYDMNALWHRGLPSNLRILLINNGNGQIFHQLPGLASPYLDDYFAAAHTCHARGWAHDAGVTYLKCSTFDVLEKAWATFFSNDTNAPVLLEAVTDRTLNVNVNKNYYNDLKQIQL